MTKVAILFVNYGPYHLARLNCFQKYCRQWGWEAIGVEVTRSGVNYNWQTKLENSVISILGEKSLEQVNFYNLFVLIWKKLSQLQIDAIAIAGYSRLSLLTALLWSQWHRKPAILLSDSKEDDDTRSWFKEKFKSWLLQHYQAALVAGKLHQAYCLKLGMPAESIFFRYDVVDNNYFHPNRIRQLPSPTQRPYFLAINRFLPKKNLLFLLDSYATYRHQANFHAWDLILCGDGPLRSQIEQKIQELNLQTSVRLTGFLQQEELLPYFAHAKCFVHASIQEQWGLVVNEAMAAGLPVLVSNRCGCFPDLIIEGKNGFGFDPTDSQQLAQLMLKISSSNCNAMEMGKAGLEHIQNFSLDSFARGLMQAVEYAKSSKS